jgi:mRNA-degrading endonuclease HigB of HigAB toxin-antitoxin module
MKFLGQMEVAEFVKAHPGQADTVRAWVAEVRLRNWPDSKALSADFQSVDCSKSPLVVFRLVGGALTIEALVNFRTGLLFLTEIRQSATDSPLH